MNTPKTISFDVSREDSQVITQIVDRAETMAANRGTELDRMSLYMDLTACHANGCPLKLRELLEAVEDYSFAHDVFGISRHIDRKTGKLTDCFLPRYSA